MPCDENCYSEQRKKAQQTVAMVVIFGLIVGLVVLFCLPVSYPFHYGNGVFDTPR